MQNGENFYFFFVDLNLVIIPINTRNQLYCYNSENKQSSSATTERVKVCSHVTSHSLSFSLSLSVSSPYAWRTLSLRVRTRFIRPPCFFIISSSTIPCKHMLISIAWKPLKKPFIIAHQRRCGMVMFSVVCVCQPVYLYNVGGSPCDHYPWCIGPHCTRPAVPPLLIYLWSSLETSPNLFTSGHSLPLLRPDIWWWLLKHVWLGQVDSMLSCLNSLMRSLVWNGVFLKSSDWAR